MSANLATYFVVGTAMTLCGLAPLGRSGALELSLSAMLAPGALAGFLLSRKIATRLGNRRLGRPCWQSPQHRGLLWIVRALL